ncbi:MAG TPA: GspMb/PilO family protein [Gemmataceae bacterium]|jgi:Tfp pilus assembly protein PilO|nr:GspMb/PilO family protein [Gemmataceae bacterium]
METGAKTTDVKTQLLERLHNPVQLRAAVTGLALLAGYLGIYLPFSSQIAAATSRLTTAQKRLRLARDIERLRAQSTGFQHRLRDNPDATEWVQYVLAGISNFPGLKQPDVHPEPPQAIGPYKALALKIALEGTFQDLTAFLRWLETNERLFRVDALTITPHPAGNGSLLMQLTVVGVMG